MRSGVSYLRFVPPAPAAPRPGKPLRLRVELVNPELRRQGVRLASPQDIFPATGDAHAGRR